MHVCTLFDRYSARMIIISLEFQKNWKNADYVMINYFLLFIFT